VLPLVREYTVNETQSTLWVTKLVYFILGYITYECHQNELLDLVYNCGTRKSSNINFRFEVIIVEVDGDLVCLLFVEEVRTSK